jgi:hypothetical protein
MLSEDEKSQIAEQTALSQSLGLGVALSLLPLAGIGSIAAIIIGLRSKKKIKASGDRLCGAMMASWYLVVGTVGLLVNVWWFWPIIFRR